MNKLFVSVLSFVLAFAGFADSGVTPATSNLVKKLTWCSLGTSITDFNDNPITGRTQGYQFYVMDKLDWSRDKLLNVGHSGKTIGVPNDFPMDTPYDIYTIEFGVNDWEYGHIVGTMDDYDNYLYNNKTVRYHKFAACYRNVIETIRKANPNAAIVLTTPRKAYGSDGNVNVSGFPRTCDGLTLESQLTKTTFWDPETNTYPDKQTYLADYAELIRQIAAQENLVLCDWYAEAATEENLASLSVDNAVHPNDVGYEIMADLLAPKILEAVSRIDFCKDGHNWGEWVVTKEASESEAGLQHRTCQRCGEEEEVVIPKIVHIVALRNVAVATAVGSAPALPATVKGLFANGAVSEEDYAVAWDDVDVPAEEGVTEVSGTATVEGKQMTVTAFVRAETAPAGTLVNISPNATPSTTGNKNSINDLVSANAPDGLVWNTSNNRAQTLTDILTWSEAVTVCKVRICYSAGHKLPAIVIFKNEGDESIQFTQGEKEVGSVHTWIEYTFNETVELNTLKCCFDMGSEGQWLVVERIWAYELQAGGKIDPLTTDTLSTLEVDGVAVDGFAPTTYNYEVDNAEAITDATAIDNMGITILPKFDGAAYVITLAEDGASTETYTVTMPSVCPHSSVTLAGAIAATCTEPGLTATATCDICHEVIREAMVIPALGHDWGEWEVKKEATEEETGLKKRTCRRDGCDAFEEEEIPLVPHTVALRNIAVAVAVGKTLTLPTTVKGLDAAGEAVADIAVTWPSVTVAYDAPGTYTVEGYATEKPAMRVKATIRAEAVEIAYKNVSTSATPTTTGGGTPKNVISPTEPGDGIDWATTNAGNMQEFVDTLTWNSPVTISSVKVCYSGNHKPPKSYAFSADASGSPEISFTQGEVETVGVHRWVEFKFNTPMTLTELRCLFVLGEGGWMIIERIWAYECEGEAEIVPSSSAALSDLRVDGKTVVDFDPETTEYTVYNGKAITAATAEGNVVVTILPKNEDDNAFVITMAEDGIATKTYTVAMPTVNIAALRNVALVVGVDMELSLPNTVMALTPTGELIGEMPVEWIDAPSSYATAGKYTVMGRAKTDASLTVTASIRAVELNITYANVSPGAQVSTTDTRKPEKLTSETVPAANTTEWVTANNAKGDLTNTLTWDSECTIVKVKVCYSAANNHHMPGVVSFFKVAGEDATLIEQTVTSDEKADGHQWTEYTFTAPVKLSTLRCFFGSPGDNQWTIVERIWAYKEVGGLDDLRSSNAKPEGVMVNGAPLKGFDPDVTTGWKVPGKNVSIESEDNIAATVLPKTVDCIIRVIALAEDGVTTKTYEFLYRGGFAIMIF